jgi:hypothetical protein
VDIAPFAGDSIGPFVASAAMQDGWLVAVGDVIWREAERHNSSGEATATKIGLDGAVGR